MILFQKNVTQQMNIYFYYEIKNLINTFIQNTLLFLWWNQICILKIGVCENHNSEHRKFSQYILSLLNQFSNTQFNSISWYKKINFYFNPQFTFVTFTILLYIHSTCDNLLINYCFHKKKFSVHFDAS